MNLEVKEALSLLIAQVYRAKSLLSCFQALMSSDVDAQYPLERLVFESNRYNDFFGVISSSLRGQLIAQCYSLLDKREDVNSVYTVYRLIYVESPNIPSDIIDIWKKIKVIRHKAVAHIDLNNTQKSIYDGADLRYEELELLVSFFWKFVSDVCKSHDSQAMLIDNANDVRVATKNILHDLFRVINEE